MPFVDFRGAVDCRCQGARLECRSLCAQPHGAALVGADIALLHRASRVLPLGDEPDNWALAVVIKLGGHPLFKAFVAAAMAQREAVKAVPAAELEQA